MGSNIWKLQAIRMLFWMQFFSAVLVPFFTDWGGISLAQVLFLNAWFFLCNFLFEVPTGTVADFLGRKVSLALGSLVGVGAALLYVSKPSFPVFMAAEAVFAIAYTLHSGADEALAYDSLKAEGRTERAAHVLARLESFKLGGIITATITGGFIASAYGLSAPMRAYVFPAALAFLLALTLREPPDTARERKTRTSYARILTEGGRYFLGHKVVRLLAIELALTNALAWGLIWLFQPLLERGGLPLRFYGVVHALSCLGQIVFLGNVARIERWVGSMRRLLLAATVLSGMSFLLLAATRWLPLVIVGIIVGFTFSLPRIPLFSAYINHHIPSERRATVLSFVSMVRTLAIVVINPLIGLLAEWSLSWTMAVLGGGLIALAAGSRVEERHLVTEAVTPEPPVRG
ncbi:MFS transporter [Archangium violaceum]|uniref:MFS transporter n=1 Tax=Archangium violaceum TaxID=83451 RepID=UPI00193BF3A1|nr:MFS transporter [Archangium violaceum]QRK05893.1 MFS transporter [Archangium violaceum]